jgi:hypothetical protein
MKDYEGKAYDFMFLRLNDIMIKQRWFENKKWEDFGGRWFGKLQYQHDLFCEQLKNPWFKFLGWKLEAK